MTQRGGMVVVREEDSRELVRIGGPGDGRQREGVG